VDNTWKIDQATARPATTTTRLICSRSRLSATSSLELGSRATVPSAASGRRKPARSHRIAAGDSTHLSCPVSEPVASTHGALLTSRPNPSASPEAFACRPDPLQVVTVSRRVERYGTRRNIGSDLCRYAQKARIDRDSVTARPQSWTERNVGADLAELTTIAERALCLTERIGNQYPLEM
jgi:hypothetical protein